MLTFAGKLPAALAALLSIAMLAGCSQTDSLGDGLGVKSAVAKVVPAGMMSASRGKRYRASAKERECLARAMFFESNRSSRDGLVAVGSVVMNRLDSGKWGSNICSVVGAKRQFAPGVLSRPMNSKALPDVMDAADAVLAGERHGKVHKNVMFFHTAGLKFPYKNMYYTVVAGGNSFYEKRSRRMRNAPQPEPSVMPDVMVASAETSVETESVTVASAALPGVADSGPMIQQPAQTALVSAPRARKSPAFGNDRSTTAVAAVSPRKSSRAATPVLRRVDGGAVMSAAAESTQMPTADRFGSAATSEAPVAIASREDEFPPAPARPAHKQLGAAPTTLQAQADSFDDGEADSEPVMSLEASDEQAAGVGALLLQQQGQ